jgi:tyrosyl-tRNA synthetase
MSSDELSVDDKVNLITRGLQEVIDPDNLIKKIMEKRPLKIYWGTAPTGRIHIGYFIPLLKMADYLKAGCEVTVLIADLHAFLDSMKSSLNVLTYRTEYYSKMIEAVLKSLNIDTSKLKFIRGTSYQLTPEYTMDMYKLNSSTTLNDATHAGAEVVKQSKNPAMTGLLYPGLQALDEQYLDCDIQTGGVDQRKIFMFARKMLPKLGYKKRIHLMTPMVPGLRFEKKEDTQELAKMSASDINSKVDLLDTKKIIKKKINKAYCLAGDVDDNSPLVLLKMIIFPILKHKEQIFTINRSDTHGGTLTFDTFEQVKEDFASEKLHPADLKLGISDSLNSFFEPIRETFSSKEMQLLINKAYPNK